jgi:hypothetical protein
LRLSALRRPHRADEETCEEAGHRGAAATKELARDEENACRGSRRGRAVRQLAGSRLVRCVSEGGVTAEPAGVVVKQQRYRWPKGEGA